MAYTVGHTIDHPRFGTVDIVVEVEISGGDPGNFRGHVDTWYPPDPPDFDYVEAWVDDDDSEHDGEAFPPSEIPDNEIDAINAKAIESSTWDVDYDPY